MLHPTCDRCEFTFRIVYPSAYVAGHYCLDCCDQIENEALDYFDHQDQEV